MEPNLKLRLSNDTAEVDQESRQELNLLDSLDNRPWNAQESNNQELRQKVQKREFCCKYCDKKFSNSQALGGHQNAHRRERALSRKEKEMMGLYHPYSHIGSHLHMTIAPHLGMPYNYLPRFMHEDGWSNKPNPMNSQIAMPQSDDYSLWSCNGEFPQLGTAVPSVLKLLP